MKKSNMIVSAIALAIVGCVVVCLVAFREKPSWKAERERGHQEAVQVQEVQKMVSFASQCTQVEELVVESSKHLRGKVFFSDSSQFKPVPQGEMKIDTLLENGGKKLTLRIEPKPGAQVIYFDLELLLPALGKVSSRNVNIQTDSKKNLQIDLKGEAACNLQSKRPSGYLVITLQDLTLLQAEALLPTDNIQIKAGGNAMVNMPKETAQYLQQKNKLSFTDNAILL